MLSYEGSVRVDGSGLRSAVLRGFPKDSVRVWLAFRKFPVLEFLGS